MYFCPIFSMKTNILYFVGLLMLLWACNGYERLLKSSDYEKKWTRAKQYFNEEDYTRSLPLLEQLVPVYRGTRQADSVNFLYAKCHFYENDYLMAAHYFKTFSTTFGNSPFVEESDYMNGYCYYLASPRPSLDQENTYQAIQSFRLFQIKYPKSSRKEDVNKYITELNEKLVEKSYMSAKLYFNLSKYKSAIVALNNSLNDYPDTKYREELMYMIVKSNYLLAYNSVEKKKVERFQNTIDEYYTFVAEFPESKFRKEADKLFNNSEEYLKTKHIENDDRL